MGDGTERAWSQGPPRQTQKSRYQLLKYGLVTSGLERKRLIKTLHKGRWIGLGKVEEEAMKDAPWLHTLVTGGLVGRSIL